MLSRVNVDRLNVRTLPSATAAIRTVITEDTVVSVGDTVGNWSAISAGDVSGYVYSDYLTTDPSFRNYAGVVRADYLNVRAGPGTSNKSLGMVRAGALLDITASLPDWLEVQFNGAVGYVAEKFVAVRYSDAVSVGEVTVDVLNVRADPGGTLIGQVPLGTQLQVENDLGDWSEVRFNGGRGFVASRYLMPVIDDVEHPAPAAANDVQEIIAERPVDSTGDEGMRPAQQLPVSGSNDAKSAARSWNQYGRLLQHLSARYEIDVGCAVAVLCVESSGAAFSSDNDNRMIIRFENHKFWSFWGKQNPNQFNECFRFRAGKAWKDHEWRRSDQEDWRSFHGNQRREWEVFEFARALDDDAAIQSISMGAPQIMGFNFQRVGYQTPRDMFDDFATDEAAHIRGLFSFFDPPMLRALRTMDFVAFAKRYNGSGQKEFYGRRIKEHYLAFKQLRA